MKQDEKIQRILDYANVFGSEAGKRVLEDLKKSFYFYRSTYVAGDPQATFVNEGSRLVPMKIEHIIKTAESDDFSIGSINQLLDEET